MSLYANIHAKRQRGEKMRKKGAKGAPKLGTFKKIKSKIKNKKTLSATHEQVFCESHLRQGLVPVGVVTFGNSLSVKSIPTDLGKSELLGKVITYTPSIAKSLTD